MQFAETQHFIVQIVGPVHSDHSDCVDNSFFFRTIPAYITHQARLGGLDSRNIGVIGQVHTLTITAGQCRSRTARHHLHQRCYYPWPSIYLLLARSPTKHIWTASAETRTLQHAFSKAMQSPLVRSTCESLI